MLCALARLRLLTSPSPVLFLCLSASQAGMLVLSPILPDVAREFGISTATAGQLRSLSGLTGGLTAVLIAMARRRMRAAANQFGYSLGAAAGGLALAVAGFAGLGIALAALFVAAALVHLPALLPGPGAVAREPARARPAPPRHPADGQRVDGAVAGRTRDVT